MKSTYALILFFVFASCANGFSQKANESKAKWPDKLKKYLDMQEQNGFSGTVLFEQNGQVVVSEGYGYSDKELKIKNTPSTVFDIGSITKQFTGAAILKSEMQGKLKVEDPITKYFGDVPNDKKGITIHQLLSHSAGFPGAVGDDYTAITNDEFIALAMSKSLRFKPGEDYEYSNVGFSLLALIIEKVSGVSYEQYMNEYLFKPSGMSQTGYVIPQWNADKMAVGYHRNKKWGKPNEKNWAADGPYLHLKGNGGILSTTEDMYKWHQALLDDKILDEAAKKKYYGKHIKEGKNAQSYYAYGWAIFPTPRNTDLITHNGGNGIFFADFWRYLDEKLTILVMTNETNRNADRMAQVIAQIVLNPDYKPAVASQQESDISEEDISEFLDMVMTALKEGGKPEWKMLLENHSTNNFFELAPLEGHYEMLAQFKERLQQGEINNVEVEGEEIVIQIETEDEIFDMIIGFVQDQKGKLRVAGLMMD